MAPPSSSTAEIQMHKNDLQTYTQRSGLPIPIYKNVNEGFDHAPKFKSTVLVGGKVYTSPGSFSTIKEAEQSSANFALHSVTKEGERNPFHLFVHQEPKTIWKSILYEFAVKMKRELPKYKTANHSYDKRPVFVSTLDFGGKSYTSGVVGSKKEAEQLAARRAIHSLGNSFSESVSRTTLNQIIQSKHKLYGPLLEINNTSLSQSTVPIAGQPECNNSEHQTDVPVVRLPTDVKCNNKGSSTGGTVTCMRKRKFQHDTWAEIQKD